MKTKTFDCVKMKHEGAKRVQALLKRMSAEQQAVFWQNETEKLRRFRERLKRQGRIR
ncbi:MAG TPA: hypothetical protein VMZ50_08525 [Phycisphaerae bacterium]|nr:hypothetical protein [Phycisphaerae bacterium]